MSAQDLLQHWREAIASWAVPASIRETDDGGHSARHACSSAIDEPAVVPPGSRSFTRAWEALPSGGTVLDVGAGTGGASLPLADRADAIIGVDTDESQLAVMVERGRRLGVQVTCVQGSWPEVADDVPPADVVVCHHVLYAVRDLEPFATALASHARRRVVIEAPQRHPQRVLNPLWERLHGIRRPDGPTADDAVEALRTLDLDPRAEVWIDRLGYGSYKNFDELTERICQRLYLPLSRSDEVAQSLHQDLAVDPQEPNPRFPGTVGRQLVTIWW